MIKELIVRKASELYGEPLVIPVSIPTDTEIRELAFDLHEKGKPFAGRVFGWDVYYHPRHSTEPGSSLPFLPACFIIGESTIWSVSYDWENGSDAPPLITSVCKSVETPQLIRQ